MVSGRNWVSHHNNISLLWSHENVNPALLWPGVCWVRFSFFFSVGHLFFWCLCWVMNECCVVTLMWFYTADTEITKANVPSGRCSDDVERTGSVVYSRKSTAELSVCTLLSLPHSFCCYRALTRLSSRRLSGSGTSWRMAWQPWLTLSQRSSGKLSVLR